MKNIEDKKIMTLAFVRRDDEILLGRKKRGFGVSKWNGLGGKLNLGEELDDAMKREVLEESGIKVEKFIELGLLNFHYIDDPDMETHIFRIDLYQGKEDHSEEMEVKWFDIGSLPFSEMWPDDKFWMPLFLANKKFEGEFWFDKDYKIVKHVIGKVFLKNDIELNSLKVN